MVASTHWLASAAGMAILERGGNAFDATVAAGFVLQVVEPHLNGPGGEVPILFHSVARDAVLVVCGQGVAPAAAQPAAFRSLGLDLVPGSGPLAACVPGAFDAWLLLLRDFGTMGLEEVLEFAIGYAELGYPLVPDVCKAIEQVEPMFREEWTDSAACYLPHGRVPAPGQLFSNKALAATYGRLVADATSGARTREASIDAARGAFYSGWVAETVGAWIERTAVMDTSGSRHRGLLSADDMAGWRASVETPATFDYRGHRVCKTGPWGQGPVMLQQLALLDSFDLDETTSEAEFAHTVVECAKLAFADRDAWYGDPAFGTVPVDELLGPTYNERRRTLVGDTASPDLRPGWLEGFPPPWIPAAPAGGSGGGPGVGEPTASVARSHRGDTCHLDVADRFGNLVSATPSGGWLSGSPVIPELGFCLGTRAQMFWLEPGHPNSLQPGKRPRTTLSPTIVTRGGEPVLAIGTPGGDWQDQWSLVALLRHLHGGLNLQEAIDAPMFHTNHLVSSFYPREFRPSEVEAEARMDAAAVEDLRRRGNKVIVRPPWALGRVCAVGREADGTLKAGANPRGMQGYAVGR